MGCSCTVSVHLVPDVQTVDLGAFGSMLHAVKCQRVITICTVWKRYCLHSTLADAAKLH